MKKNNWIFRAVCMTLASLILTATVSVAADVGSSGDPLVTLSYLNDTYFNAILSKVDSRIAAQGGGSGTSGTASTFTLVTLSSGQTLKGGIGCEVMLRVGTATCSASSTPGLIDTTDATTLNNGGALVKNHVYMMTIEDRGVKATAATVKLMVRGEYTIK
ncbi:hypothetical protein H8790_07080 [Oscillibacter hominis]|uniref:Uncharacterized protein n=1 Tax=Oscillibacter hominis TaxID=2763056 RepID=A0A7G9B869_9FIRM|nr:hypothetical protein [Oscillibacter hominis]QNL45750.1 hypothetical protein H8790_07080 [Oscillibacter hominis]